MPAKKDERFYLYKGHQRRPPDTPITGTGPPGPHASTSAHNNESTVSVLVILCADDI